MIIESFQINNELGLPVRGDIRMPDARGMFPVLLICHGFKGFKDWGFFPLLSESLANHGFITVNFNFSGSGIGADLQNFTETDLFFNNNYSRELADVRQVVDFIANHPGLKSRVEFDRFGLIGHSRGGGIAILYAADDPRIKSVATLSAISTVQRYSEDNLEQWRQAGYIEIENKRTGQILKIGTNLLHDITANKKQLDILSAAAQLQIPALIIHGEQDEAVPVTEARAIFAQLQTKKKKIEIVSAATHTYNMVHPAVEITEQFRQAIDSLTNWFAETL